MNLHHASTVAIAVCVLAPILAVQSDVGGYRAASGTIHNRPGRFLLSLVASSFITRAVGIAEKIMAHKKDNMLQSTLSEANAKLDEINVKLGKLSNQLRAFELSMSHQVDLLKLTALFGPYVERLNFLTKDVGLQNRNEAAQIDWADAVLSLRNDGIAQSLSSIHRLILGTSLFNTKSIMDVFMDGLPIPDDKFWEKTDAFVNVLLEMETAGYWAWLVALGIKGQKTEIVRVSHLGSQQLNEQESRVFGPLNSLRTWPAHTYGLVKVRTTGCPAGTWLTGSRYHDTEDSRDSNSFSNPLHAAGMFHSNNIVWNFCIKNVVGNGPQWPAGKYCIFAYHGCPPGMGTGSILWDDEQHHNHNSYSGTLPDGIYNHQTKVNFCCMNTGSTATEIRLPFEKPFYLFPLEGQGCQSVYKMTVREEFIHWDCEDHNNVNARTGLHPKDDGGGDVSLHMCYYERTS